MANEILTAAEIRAAAPREKMYRLRDGGNLFLQIEITGRKWWAFRYTFAGRQKSLSCGVFPTVTLAKARDKARTMREQLAEGADPAAARKTKEEKPETLADVAAEWLARFKASWTPKYAKQLATWLDASILPRLGKRPMVEITAQQLLAELRRVEAAGTLNTAHRLRAICGQLWRYGVATGRCERDVAHDLRGALAPAVGKSMSTILEPERIGKLLRDIDDYGGDFVTRCCLQLAPLCLLRPGELRQGRWSEIDLDAAEWRLPYERMKARLAIKTARQGETAHIVPLSRQSVEILRRLYAVTGHGEFIFAGRKRNKPLANHTLGKALELMGYAGEQCVHGLRATASTLLHEFSYPSHLIERQLAHADRDKIRAKYNFADYLPERRQMLQAWADYLDQLRAGNGGKVVPIRKAMGG